MTPDPPVPTSSNLRTHWQLDPQIDFLNHGSFGATPVAVLREQRRIQDALEREPVRIRFSSLNI